MRWRRSWQNQRFRSRVESSLLAFGRKELLAGIDSLWALWDIGEWGIYLGGPTPISSARFLRIQYLQTGGDADCVGV